MSSAASGDEFADLGLPDAVLAAMWLPPAASKPPKPLDPLALAISMFGQDRGPLLHDLTERGAGDFDRWPQWVRDLATLPDRTLIMKERFALTLFFLGNGVLPRAVAAFLVGAKLLADDSARRHVWDIMRDFRAGKLCGECRYYCVQLQANVRISGTDSMWAGGAPPGPMRAPEIWVEAHLELLGSAPSAGALVS